MKKVREGSVELEVPDVKSPEEGEVFYNPHMALARDISLCIYSQFEGSFCDLLAASGARGLRLAGHLEVTLNDADPRAAELMRKNAEKNGLDVEVTNERADNLLAGRCFDIVDVDPFGSPVHFLDAACRSAKGVLGVCATDTAVLAGNYPQVCRRRYLARPIHNEYFKEAAVRILCGYVVRNSAKYDVALRPIFVHATRHYYRAYFSVSRGAKRANRVLEDVGTWETEKGKKGGEAGPMWMGSLWEGKVVEKAMKIAEGAELARPEKTRKLLERIEGEIDAPLFYHDYHKICREAGVSPVKMETVLEETEGVRTHFLETGIKTGMERKEIAEILKRRARKG